MDALPTPMSESQFWELVTQIDHPLLLSGQDTESLRPLQIALSGLPPDEIMAFALRLADRLGVLLNASRARQGPFGDDALLYAACHSIARGQAWFEASRHWPGIFDQQGADSEMAWCEALLYVGRKAWSRATGLTEDDFPVWTLEEGLNPFVTKLPTAQRLAEDHSRAAATWLSPFTVYAHFEQHPGLERTVEPDAHVPVTLAEVMADYFWCLLDLGDYLGFIDEDGNSFQILYDASKNLYWAEVPNEAERISYGQEFSREAILALLHQLPKRFSPTMFESPQALAWDE
ncbi:DUF4240 domain-containing protein [Ottowia thiooxydans]|uniref:DUF4240 domain-containing protein n=1 Tax=Ottowia thiooxydans TaxID=219182 RepID=UPI00048E0A13|nr:DUF4240 domain-containing protein [Ottowia thiooxydans]